MKFIRVIKAYYERSEINPNRNDGTLVFKVELDFSSSESAIKFRQNLPDGDDNHIHINYDDERLLKLYKNIEMSRYYHSDKIDLNTTHLEFKVYKHFGGNDFEKDYSNEVEKTRKQIIDLFHNYTPNVKVTLIPPELKRYDYKDKPFIEMQDRVDTLFESLSTAEIRNYDFVIVGKDKAEAESIRKYYIQNSRYGATKWQYRTKDDLSDYDKKEGDMTYIKTVSQELDNGIYCLTVRARNYFKSWKGEQTTLIPIYDAKASQLGGKVVIAKKNNFIRVLKASKDTYRVVEQDGLFYLVNNYDQSYKDEAGNPIEYKNWEDANDMKYYLNTDSYGKTSDAIRDIIQNFEKITGVPFNKLFNTAEEGESIFNDDIVFETNDTLMNYVENKYNIDYTGDFVEELDDALANQYPY